MKDKVYFLVNYKIYYLIFLVNYSINYLIFLVNYKESI